MLQGNHVVSKLLLLCFCIMVNDALLSAPWNVSMESVNMRHRLRWSPPRAPCLALHYSVQFQGEWELHYKNGSWEEAMGCQHILATECDLTPDLATDSDYNIRVRTECNGQDSRWTTLNTTFNRRKTFIAITMDVKVSEDAVHVYIAPQSLAMTVFLTMWEQGEEHNATAKMLDVGHLTHVFPGLKQGSTYCLRAQATVEGSSGSVSSNVSRCVSIPNCQKSWQVPVVVTTVLMVTVALACLLGWATKHRRRVIQNYCLHKEPLPSVLNFQVDDQPVCASTLEERCETLDIPLVAPAP